MNPALSNGGRIGAAITNYRKREKVKQAERRTAETPVPKEARCLSCPSGHDTHTVMIPPSLVEEGKTLWLYCPQHEKRRNLSEAYVYGRVI